MPLPGLDRRRDPVGPGVALGGLSHRRGLLGALVGLGLGGGPVRRVGASQNHLCRLTNPGALADHAVGVVTLASQAADGVS